QLRAERQAGQQRQLVGRVEAADVEGWVRLRVAAFLGLLQHLGEGPALLLHRREDVVTRTVEDAVHAADLVSEQRLAHRLDDRYAARDRRLEIESDAAFLSQSG